MILELAIKWFVPFACGGIAAGCVTYINMRRAKDRALESGVQCLLRDSIVSSYEKYANQGYCPIHGRETIKQSYTAYKALGGNDVATELYHRIMKLPVDHETAQRSKN